MRRIFSTPLPLRDAAILLDVDGTLLDLAPTPREVFVPAELRLTLDRLHELTGGALALVSGRPLAELDLIFAPLQLPTIGGHGAELRPSSRGATDRGRATPLDADLKRRFATIAAAGPGILVEDKGYAIALHYRLAPEKAALVHETVAAIRAEVPAAPLQLLPGKAVLEIKSSGFDKGTAVRQLMTIPPFAGRRPVFIGDDTTDEAAFAVLPDFKGVGISVGRKIPDAAICMETPDEVRRWLGQISQGDGTIP